MSLRLRLNLILLACFGVGLLGSAAYYRYETLRLTSEALEYEARLHMQTAMAVREFVIEQVKPRIADRCAKHEHRGTLGFGHR